MTKKKVSQPPLKEFTAWTVSNWGIPWTTERTRRMAIEYAQNLTGKPWRKIRDHCAVHKVKVTPL